MKKFIYIIDGARTGIANPYKGLKSITVGEMSAAVIEALVSRNRIKPASVREVIFGNTVSAGTGQNFTRQAIHLAGLPSSIPGYAVDHVCVSGMQSVMIAANNLLAGRDGIFIAGGAESATHTPNILSKDESSKPEDKIPVDSLIYDGLWCVISGRHVGQLCEELARKEKIGREAQDVFALNSHQKTCAAIREGKFLKEIVPVRIAAAKIFEKDDRPRKNISLEKLAGLPPVFHKEGTITAGNASIPCDGAAALALADKDTVRKGRLKSRARILGYATAAVEAKDVFASAPLAVREVLKITGKTMKDIDLFEIGESFSAQAIYAQNTLKIPDEKMNVWGGDVALGHPLGAVGARILVTLIHALEDQKRKRGVACVCAGGTGSVSFLVERT